MHTCGSECADTTSDPAHCGSCDVACVHGQFCFESQCHCLPGLTLCNGGCVDFTSNPDHCGGCPHPCADGQKCEAGACGTGACSVGLTACLEPSGKTACVNLALGYPRCGSCDIVCDPTQTCVGGQCRDYEPASPCTTCPCAAECQAALGSPSTCCDGLYGGTEPVCVQGAGCP